MDVKKDFLYMKAYAIIFALISFYISYNLYKSGVFFKYDLLFDTDPISNLKSLSHGFTEGRNSYTHAFLEFFSVPIYLVEKLISLVFINVNEREVREILALTYAPVFTALSILKFYMILIHLNLSRIQLLLGTLIFSLMFTNIVFSVIVETYAISGYLMTLLIYFYVKSKDNSNFYHTKYWLLLAVIISGVTITNIVIFSIVYFFHILRHNESVVNAIIRTTMISILALFIVFILYELSHYFFDVKKSEFEGSSTWLSSAIKDSIFELISNFINFFTSSFNSFFGIDRVITKIEGCTNNLCEYVSFVRLKDSYLIFAYTSIFFTIILVLFLNYLRANRNHSFHLMLVSIIAFNLVFHTFFGSEVYLYSQHWNVPLALLVLFALIKYNFLLILFFIIELVIAISFIVELNQLYL